MAYASIVAVLALLEYYVFILLVGKMRGECKIQAPATTGDPKFERYYRVQQNTAEQLIVFLPALYLFAAYVDGTWAAVVGLAFIAGRAWYAVSYYEEAKKRSNGFLVTFLSEMVLLVGGLIGAIRAAF
ncbi:MAG: MAPEG family protein [Chrysiogenetes bacterium]|nr:MAPEG family protein [Chrysiogenetes bacterium]